MPVPCEVLSMPEILTSIVMPANPEDEDRLLILKMVSKDFRRAIQQLSQQLCEMRLSVYASLETELRCIFEADQEVKISSEDNDEKKLTQFESDERKLVVSFTYAFESISVCYHTTYRVQHFMCFKPYSLLKGYANFYANDRIPRYMKVSYRVKPIEIVKQRNILEWVDDML